MKWNWKTLLALVGLAITKMTTDKADQKAIDALKAIETEANDKAKDKEGKDADPALVVKAIKLLPQEILDQHEQSEKAVEIELDEITGEVDKVVRKALKDELPESRFKQITDDGLKKIVRECLADARKDSQKLDADTIGKAAGEATKRQISELRKESKMIFDDKEGEGKDDKTGKVEFAGYALTKGNLPVHMKQLLNVCMKRSINHGLSDGDMKDAREKGDKVLGNLMRKGAKALTSTGVGTGDEWVPTDLSAELHRRLYLSSLLAQQFMTQEIAMPTNPYTIPISSTRPTFYGETVENVETDASEIGTANNSLTAVPFRALVQYSDEVDEDSIIPILPNLQMQLGEAAAAALEDAIINGDTAATHQDSDTHAIAKHPAKYFDGLRKLALAITALKVSLATGGITAANLLAVKKLLGKWGRNKANLLWIISPSHENDFLGLAEVITADKRGTGGTSVTGEIANIWGIPIIVSEASRDNLNASGVYDGSTTTKGSVLLFNKAEFWFGSRREFTLETDKNIKSGTNNVVASFRKAFKAAETPSATIKTVALGFNFNT